MLVTVWFIDCMLSNSVEVLAVMSMNFGFWLLCDALGLLRVLLKRLTFGLIVASGCNTVDLVVSDCTCLLNREKLGCVKYRMYSASSLSFLYPFMRSNVGALPEYRN